MNHITDMQRLVGRRVTLGTSDGPIQGTICSAGLGGVVIETSGRTQHVDVGRIATAEPIRRTAQN